MRTATIASSGSQQGRRDEMSTLLARAVLEGIDLPILVVAVDSSVLMVNTAARRVLCDDSLLQIRDGWLCVVGHRGCSEELRNAIIAAGSRALQRLLILRGAEARELAVGVVPIAGDTRCVLVTLARAALCTDLTLTGYASAAGLTPSEAAVLRELCNGFSPMEIARLRGIKVSTVRSQIEGLRLKTQSSDLRDVIRKVSTLPVMPNRLEAVKSGTRASCAHSFGAPKFMKTNITGLRHAEASEKKGSFPL